MRRERHNLSMLTAFISPSSECRLSRPKVGSQLTAFSQIPKSSAHASSVWCYSHPLVSFPIWNFYFDISEWHILSVSAWTPELMLYLTNLCTKQKVFILTKPKGKIYKMKSLRHYNSKAPFSIATILRSREGHYSFPGFLYLPLIHTL